MKRLVDESTDELTRSLLAAGIEHRPAPGNKAQVIVALGAGSAIGLLSSNAFAWLGTTAGKVTAAGVAVGVAGALFVVAPELERRAGPHAAVHSTTGASPAQPEVESALLARQPDPAGSLDSMAGRHVERATAPTSEGEALLEPAPQPSPPGAVAGDVSPSEGSASVVSGSALSDSAPTLASASDKAATKKLSLWRERRLAARRKAVLSRAAGSQGASARTASSTAAEASHDEAVAAAEAGAVAMASPGLAAGGVSLQGVEKPDLDSEVRLVDDMHRAARRNDRAALGRFLARYRETFPDGQLKKEVAEFATRLDQADLSRAP
jgi:hypothetical protein